MQHLVGHSSFEGDIVKYYELFFYSGKQQYLADVTNYIECYVGSVLGKHIIDIGCGTGIFDEYFVEKGADVFAVDISKDMIDYAKSNHGNKSIIYQVHDICDAPVEKKGDVAIALSHVIGYQLDNVRLRSFLKNISESLKLGGIFAFNFYNAPAILSKTLMAQFREIQTDGVMITRVSNVMPNHMKNTLEMQYRYLIEQEGAEPVDIKIVEEMRYYSLMELENCLYDAGFKIKHANNFMLDEELSWEEWNGFIVVEKIID